MGVLSESGKNNSQPVQDAIAMYRAMNETRIRIVDLRAANKEWKNEDVRFRRLEVKVNDLWKILTNAEQLQAATVLVDNLEMNPRVIDMLNAGDRLIKL